MKSPQGIIQRHCGIHWTKSFALDFVLTLWMVLGSSVSVLGKACPEISVDSGPTVAALQVFLSFIKAFCLNDSVETNLARQNSLPTFSSLSESFRHSVYSGKKSLIWMFYGFSKLFTHANKTLYSSDEFLNTRYIMMQCIFLWIRRLEQGCRPAYFENEIYNYSKRLYTSNLRQWIGLLFITAFYGNTVCHMFIELSQLLTEWVESG